MCEFTPLLRSQLEVDVANYQTRVGVFFKGQCVLEMTYDETLDLIAALVHSAAIIKGTKR